MSCDPSFLASITMFELLNEDNRIALAVVVDELSLPQGHTLFQSGDPGDSLFIVQSGQIELFIKDTAGQKIILTTAEAGDMFGELAMLDTGPRTATARHLPTARCWCWTETTWSCCLNENPKQPCTCWRP